MITKLISWHNVIMRQTFQQEPGRVKVQFDIPVYLITDIKNFEFEKANVSYGSIIIDGIIKKNPYSPSIQLQHQSTLPPLHCGQTSDLLLLQPGEPQKKLQ